LGVSSLVRNVLQSVSQDLWTTSWEPRKERKGKERKGEACIGNGHENETKEESSEADTPARRTRRRRLDSNVCRVQALVVWSRLSLSLLASRRLGIGIALHTEDRERKRRSSSPTKTPQKGEREAFSLPTVPLTPPLQASDHAHHGRGVKQQPSSYNCSDSRGIGARIWERRAHSALYLTTQPAETLNTPPSRSRHPSSANHLSSFSLRHSCCPHQLCCLLLASSEHSSGLQLTSSFVVE
ncbi:hypothetical protein EJB05_40219, partial [Eragrostis curvula]